jgi:hypothetical protein
MAEATKSPHKITPQNHPTKSPHLHSGSIYTEPAGTSPAGATCLCPVGGLSGGLKDSARRPFQDLIRPSQLDAV